MNNEVINETQIIYIFKGANELLNIGYYPISDFGLKVMFNKLSELSDNDSWTTEEILNFIKKHHPELFRRYYYAEKISDSYNTIDKVEYETYLDYFKSSLKEKLNIMHKSLCHKYSCRELIDKINPLHFSHRVAGFYIDEIVLNDLLKAYVNTNFGYGYSSYFQLTIVYRDIKIHRFTYLIKYRQIYKAEIIACTETYALQDKCWHELYKDLQNAYNLLKNNEQLFIKEYIINECIGLIHGLKEIFNNDNHHVLVDNFRPLNIVYDETDMSIKLRHKQYINVRAERISFALNFIESILLLEDYVEVANIVSEIENINKLVYPLVESELDIINKDLEYLTDKKMSMQPIYDEVKNKYESVRNSRNEYSDSIRKKNPNIESEELTKLVDQAFPDYNNLSSFFSKINNQYNEICWCIFVYEDDKVKLSGYSEIIENYFKSKQ